MLEIITALSVDTASQLTIISAAVQSISASVAVVVGAVMASLASISGICAWVVSVLPHPAKDNWYSTLHHVLNILGANVGNASNAVTGIVEKEV